MPTGDKRVNFDNSTSLRKKIRKFGEWITAEPWENISLDDEPSEQVRAFEGIVTEKLNEIFPQKITKLGIEDQPFMTSELKALKRRRMR